MTVDIPPSHYEHCVLRHLDGHADEEQEEPCVIAAFDSKHLSKNEIQIILNG